jgi:two-component system, chemotaxis family, CheB/CheR fusion protein
VKKPIKTARKPKRAGVPDDTLLHDGAGNGAATPPRPRPRVPAEPAAAATEPARRDEGLIVVGIGASAGGLEALQQLVEAMPPDTGMAFVHIQHLDPTHKSIMADLLRGSTKMKVVEAEDDSQLEPNCLYISPSDRDVAVLHGKLHLVEPADPHRGHLPIDFFFRSLARDQGDRAIGIILSGTATDGTLGIRAIKGAGGMAIAQEPKSAKFDGMPRSAIATQVVDFVVPPREMPRVLLDYVRHPYVHSTDAVAPTPAGQLDQIYVLLREQTGHDFSHYKQNTIRRRIERRMAVHQLKRLDDYVRYLRRFPSAVDALFKDLLIGVTNFFRDPEAFRALEERVVPRLVEGSGSAGQIRIWVPSCSTGEEAYSIAMMLGEHMDRTRQNRKVTIFATDIDPAAIDVARTAVYTDSIAADVTPERIDHLFTKENGSYRIAKRIREMVIFAVQDVLKDPPFSKIDLISCRNLLIYLEPDLQRKLMQLFHAVLNPGGFLVLGASETVGEAGDLFLQLDKKWKIYEKKPVSTHPLIGVTSLHTLNEGGGVTAQRTLEPAQPPGIGELTARVLLESYAPACVVVDEHYEIVYLQGPTAHYLELPVGEPRLNLLKMARNDLLRELRTALHKAQKERAEVVCEHLTVVDGGATRAIRLRVKPFRGPRVSQQLFLVAFEDLPPDLPATGGGDGKKPTGKAADGRVVELERKLASMKESLRSTVEEVETSNEELRSTNEELQSANEELQSTNEELETSKEELQSVNEELMTVNNELQKKLEELSQANNDLTNLLNSTEIGTIFLDNDLRIKRFTPAMGKLVNLIPTDVGRPIHDIVTQLIDDNLADQAHEVLRSLVFHEVEVRTKDGRWYLRRILPYRTVDNVIDGVVVTFVNITEVREAQRMAEAMRAYANAIVNTMPQPVVLLNKEGRVKQGNDAFYTLFDLRREDTLGARVYDLDGASWNLPGLHAGLDAVLEGGPPLKGLAVEMSLPARGKRSLRFHANRVAFGTKAVAGEEELTVVTIEDAARS